MRLTFRLLDQKQIIRRKLIVLYVLNVTDLIFTYHLLATGFFYEWNGFVRLLMNSDAATAGVKIVLPAVLLSYVAVRMNDATDRQLQQASLLVNLMLFPYMLLNVWHIVCFVMAGVLSETAF